ncbi:MULTISPECIES: hypothetical protein [unclassified Mesorhizobium]|uniref:hypothetical protein n=1 Tax=unclassified Mesorhizobium TaxID=325217 RepID=UPI001AEDEBFE|nr:MULTISPECIES: hypothetical protein [unclassified Mesorhizobium]MCA0016645.1 hypothetical protein [Mesorhizobium sp. B294B1A1]
MTGFSVIVLGKPSPQVGCDADITLTVGSLAFQQVYIPHDRPSFAEASKGILLRAEVLPIPLLQGKLSLLPSFAEASEGILLRAEVWTCPAKLEERSRMAERMGFEPTRSF